MSQIRYNTNRILIFFSFSVFLLFSTNVLHAQFTEFDPNFYYQKSLYIQKTGMIVLGSWAGLNILSGLTGNFTLQNEAKYFFQMSAAGNVVNLGIAVYGFAGFENALLDVNPEYMLSEMNKFDRILLINAGLDLIYIGTGSYLLNRGLRNNNSRFIGYGRSIILQGGFLFFFDLVLYLTHSPNTTALFQITEKINVTATGFTVNF